MHLLIETLMNVEIEQLGSHGINKQIREPRIRDECSERSYPSGVSIVNHDSIGRRTRTGRFHLLTILTCLTFVAPHWDGSC
jgi:hypothetical protein